ncbi:hypothetical protein V8B55DRAFT_1494212 [Mucor lusitanicus]|uniref:C2H2-type domain-containing protein n=1 Tax=Mucor circinelloides f. lusitanicus TaxID=29924 RepID=A0A8H4BN30_MUCCL|nr:hypothetical protein FB192DRAFT_1361262 [Mucor lusitanicus]
MTRAKRSISTASASGSRNKTRLRNETDRNDIVASVERLSVAAHSVSSTRGFKKEDTDKIHRRWHPRRKSNFRRWGLELQQRYSNYSSDNDRITARTATQMTLEDHGYGKSNPNFYCRVCKATDTALSANRKHCTRIHHMKLATLKKPYKPIPGVKPDPHYLNVYRRAFQATFLSTKAFSVHLNMKHWAGFSPNVRMTKPRLFDPNIKLDPDDPGV